MLKRRTTRLCVRGQKVEVGWGWRTGEEVEEMEEMEEMEEREEREVGAEREVGEEVEVEACHKQHRYKADHTRTDHLPCTNHGWSTSGVQ